VHPIAFQLGSYTVHWYGIMMAVAFLAGLWTASRRGLRDGFSPETILDIGPWAIVGVILGARVVYVATYWNTLMADPLFPKAPWTEVFMVQRGGLVFYGGLIGGALATVIFARVKKVPLWKLADVLAPSIALGYVFGRIGCLLNGCCYGQVCSLPWAIHFPNQSYAWEHQFALGLVGPHDPSAPVHPTQIYDSLLNLVLYLGLAWLYRRKKFNGQVFATYLLCYAVTRSIVEMFRGDYTPAHLHDGLTPAHLISIGVFAAGLGLFWLLPRPLAKPEPAPAQQQGAAARNKRLG
jgi:phosphatidylglycerol---prolipoprotein diacylglyceryl transferase